MGLKSQEFELFVCDDRLRTEASLRLELTRLELVHLPTPETPADEEVHFEFQDSPPLAAKKYFLAAHSPVFRALFFGHCVEAMSGRAEIADFGAESFRVFLAMLDSHVAYAMLQRPPEDVDMVEVWAIADKYCTSEVRSMAEAIILQSLEGENLRELLESCRRYQSDELAERICGQVLTRSKDACLLKGLVADGLLPAKRARLE